MTRRSLSPRGSFWTAAGVLVLSLWASGAPAMLYPTFAELWGTGTVATTALFAVYPAALVLVMVTCGSLSDRYGRRRLLLTGVATVAIGTALFALTSAIPLAFAGRVLQGAGVGLAMSAASAALVEYNTTGTDQRASAVNTAATAVGAAAAIVAGGFFVQHTSSPTHLTYWLLLAVVAGLGIAIYFLPDDRPATRSHLPRALVAIPTTGRGAFLLGASAVTVAFITGAVFLALGAQIIRELVGTTNAFTGALTLATWPLVIVPTTLYARHRTPRAAAALGGLIAATGLLLMLAAGVADSLLLFLGSAVLAGIGYGLLVYGGLGLVTTTTQPHTRAGTFSAMYLAAYLAQASTALALGALTTAVGLNTTILTTTPVITALCLTIPAITLRTGDR